MTEKNVLIVGASRGIGLGLVKEFLAEGDRVIATVRDTAKASDLTALASSSGGKVKIETVDTADAKSADGLRERLAGETFDVVVVNAGVGGPQANPRTVSDEDFNTLFLTNALGPVRIAELMVKQVKPQTGVIGLMTSQLGSVEGASSGGVELLHPQLRCPSQGQGHRRALAPSGLGQDRHGRRGRRHRRRDQHQGPRQGDRARRERPPGRLLQLQGRDPALVTRR
jgi:NAD(P)-dependent dehydrogenase (short-subunit alcohol dehydrogenase family)